MDYLWLSFWFNFVSLLDFVGLSYIRVVRWSLYCRALQPKINPHQKVGANARGDNDYGVEKKVCYLGLREDASVLSKIVGIVVRNRVALQF